MYPLCNGILWGFIKDKVDLYIGHNKYLQYIVKEKLVTHPPEPLLSDAVGTGGYLLIDKVN